MDVIRVLLLRLFSDGLFKDYIIINVPSLQEITKLWGSIIIFFKSRRRNLPNVTNKRIDIIFLILIRNLSASG